MGRIVVLSQAEMQFESYRIICKTRTHGLMITRPSKRFLLMGRLEAMEKSKGDNGQIAKGSLIVFIFIFCTARKNNQGYHKT